MNSCRVSDLNEQMYIMYIIKSCPFVSTTNYSLQKCKYSVSILGIYINLSAIVLSLQIPADKHLCTPNTKPNTHTQPQTHKHNHTQQQNKDVRFFWTRFQRQRLRKFCLDGLLLFTSAKRGGKIDCKQYLFDSQFLRSHIRWFGILGI